MVSTQMLNKSGSMENQVMRHKITLAKKITYGFAESCHTNVVLIHQRRWLDNIRNDSSVRERSGEERNTDILNGGVS